MRCVVPRVSTGRTYEVKSFYRSAVGFDALFLA